MQLSDHRQINLGEVPVPIRGETPPMTRDKTPATNSYSTEVKTKTASLTRNKPTPT